MPAHLVPDFALITDEMTARLGNEAALRIEEVTIGYTAKRGEPIKEKRLVPGPFRCVIQTEGGRVMEFGTGPELCMVQRMVAEDMVTELNRQLHHDGCWLFNFAIPEPSWNGWSFGRARRSGKRWVRKRRRCIDPRRPGSAAIGAKDGARHGSTQQRFGDDQPGPSAAGARRNL
jgi:hypothetical protein